MKTRKAIAALALLAGIGIGHGGTALAGTVGPGPVRIKAFPVQMPADAVLYEDGSGWYPDPEWSGAAPRQFCVEDYGCTRQRGEGGGPRWARLVLALDHVDGDFDGMHFGRPIVDKG